MVRRIEWIGAKSPKNDEMIQFRLTTGQYTREEARIVNLSDILVKPLIRQFGSRKRVKRPKHAAGYSKTYEWGPYQFIQVMEDIDADRMFSKDPDELEFRDLDNPAHDSRTPQVPWAYITKNLHRIMKESENGPKLVQVDGSSARNVMQVGALLDKLTEIEAERDEKREWREKRRG